jgi:hypothetical protein
MSAITTKRAMQASSGHLRPVFRFLTGRLEGVASDSERGAAAMALAVVLIPCAG